VPGVLSLYLADDQSGGSQLARILIMEDDLHQARDMRVGLVEYGHETVVDVHDVDAALDQLSNYPFDLLIADCFVRKDGEIVSQGGIVLVSKIRLALEDSKLNRARDIPIIMVTGGLAQGSMFQIQKPAELLGVTSILRKPVSIRELVLEVARVLRNSKPPA
jgi:CheY-like chemotaxis protein